MMMKKTAVILCLFLLNDLLASSIGSTAVQHSENGRYRSAAAVPPPHVLREIVANGPMFANPEEEVICRVRTYLLMVNA
jgi:hypothetical protein